MNIGAAYAQDAMQKSTKVILPSFIEGYLQYQAAEAGLNATRVNQIRTLWLHQLEIRQQKIDASLAIGNNLMSDTGANYINGPISSWMLRKEWTEPYNGGVVYNEDNVLGTPDGIFAELYTPYYPAVASIVGTMSGSYSSGDVYAVAEQGPTASQHTGNYIVVEISPILHNSMEGWMEGFVGYAQIETPWCSPEGGNYYIGTAPYTFAYLSVGCIVMAPPNPLDPYNDVMVDSVYSSQGNPPVTLTVLSSDEGGYTNISPGEHLYPQYEQPELIATPDPYYAFDHWEEDGNNVGSTNPIWIPMDTSHILKAVFQPIDHALLTVYTKDQGGNDLPANIFVDGNWIGCGCGSAYLSVGPHTIDVDNYVWDDYWGTYVSPLSSNWYGVLTGDYTVTVYYGY